MYTQCPDCQTRFRVTAGALRAAHGTVRCGRCGGAFDALPHLSDSLPLARPETAAVPIDLGGVPAFAPIESLDLSPVIEAELARLDEMELARLDSVELTDIGDTAAESTAVLVDETGTAEDITLEGENVRVEDAAPPRPEPAEPGTEAAGGPVARKTLAAEDLPEPDGDDLDPDVDLDITDRFEVLRIPASAYPDPQEAEREFEALVQRLQREFDARAIAERATHGDEEEDTAETVALTDEASDEQTATLEPGAGELTAEFPVAEAAAPEVATPEAAAPEAAAPESATPDAAAPDEPLRALAGTAGNTPAPGAGEPTETAAIAAGPSADAVVAPRRETPVVIPVGERPLSNRRWRSTPEELLAEAPPARSAGSLVAWSIGSLLLALALAAQVVHHYRQELARDARFGPTLRSAYERLGVALPPSTDLGALELRQSGDDERAGGRMVVHASLTNRASFAQPLPVLRLQFEDRYGVVIAARDFEPTDYLKDPERAGQPLAPAASGDVELELADPGADAVGYRLEVCLRETPTLMRCAPGSG